MENKKTISFLNSKVWYRFIKVLFIISILIFLSIFNYIIVSGGVKKIDQEKTTIQCNLGEKKSFSTESINLSLDTGAFNNELFEYKGYFIDYPNIIKEKIITECFPKKTGDIYDIQKQAEIINKNGFTGRENNLTEKEKITLDDNYNIYLKEINNVTGSSKIKYLDFSFHMFEIIPSFTYIPFINLFLFGNIIIFVVFEIIKRIFYYIILGSIKPKK